MSVIIRLQNLPWSANAADIRQFFVGLTIPEGGVHIVGGSLGDAFIAFGSDEDARLAMQREGTIQDTRLKLLLSSRAEMSRVIEQVRSQNAAPATPTRASPPRRAASPPSQRAAPVVIDYAKVTQLQAADLLNYQNVRYQQNQLAAVPNIIATQQPVINSISPANQSSITPFPNLVQFPAVAAVSNQHQAQQQNLFPIRNQSSSLTPEPNSRSSASWQQSVQSNIIQNTSSSVPLTDRGPTRWEDTKRTKWDAPQNDFQQQRAPQNDFQQQRVPQSDFQQLPRAPQSDFQQLPRAPQSDFQQLPRVPQSDFQQLPRAPQNDLFSHQQRIPQSDFSQLRVPPQNDFQQLQRAPPSDFHQVQRAPQNDFSQLQRAPQNDFLHQQRAPQNDFSQQQRGSQNDIKHDPQRALDIRSPWEKKPEYPRAPNNQQWNERNQSNSRFSSLDSPLKPFGEDRPAGRDNWTRDDREEGDRWGRGRGGMPNRTPNFNSPGESRFQDNNQRNASGETGINSYLMIRGLPYVSSYGEIREFFRGLNIPPDGIKIILDNRGNRTGMAAIMFTSEKDAEEGLRKSGRLIKDRAIRVETSTETEFLQAHDKRRQNEISWRGRGSYRNDADRTRNRSRDRFRRDRRSGSKSKSRSRSPGQYRSRGRNRSRSRDKDRSRDRSRERSRRKSRERSRERSRDKDRGDIQSRDKDRTEFKPKEVEVKKIDPDMTCIAIRNLPDQVTEEEIAKLFTKFDDIEIILSGTKDTGFVSFKSTEDAKVAMELNGCKIRAKMVELNLITSAVMKAAIPTKVAEKPAPAVPVIPKPVVPQTPKVSTTCVKVTNLSLAANSKNVFAFFQKEALKPFYVHIIYDKCGKSVGEAFCEFKTIEETERALKLNSKEILKMPITLNPVSKGEMIHRVKNPPLGTPTNPEPTEIKKATITTIQQAPSTSVDAKVEPPKIANVSRPVNQSPQLKSTLIRFDNKPVTIVSPMTTVQDVIEVPEKPLLKEDLKPSVFSSEGIRPFEEPVVIATFHKDEISPPKNNPPNSNQNNRFTNEFGRPEVRDIEPANPNAFGSKFSDPRHDQPRPGFNGPPPETRFEEKRMPGGPFDLGSERLPNSNLREPPTMNQIEPSRGGFRSRFEDVEEPLPEPNRDGFRSRFRDGPGDFKQDWRDTRNQGGDGFRPRSDFPGSNYQDRPPMRDGFRPRSFNDTDSRSAGDFNQPPRDTGGFQSRFGADRNVISPQNLEREPGSRWRENRPPSATGFRSRFTDDVGSVLPDRGVANTRFGDEKLSLPPAFGDERMPVGTVMDRDIRLADNKPPLIPSSGNILGVRGPPRDPGFRPHFGDEKMAAPNSFQDPPREEFRSRFTDKPSSLGPLDHNRQLPENGGFRPRFNESGGMNKPILDEDIREPLLDRGFPSSRMELGLRAPPRNAPFNEEWPQKDDFPEEKRGISPAFGPRQPIMDKAWPPQDEILNSRNPDNPTWPQLDQGPNPRHTSSPYTWKRPENNNREPPGGIIGFGGAGERVQPPSFNENLGAPVQVGVGDEFQIELRNVPYTATKMDIVNFFLEGRFEIGLDDVRFRLGANGKGTGEARVAFKTMSFAQRALDEMNGRWLNGRTVRMHMV